MRYLLFFLFFVLITNFSCKSTKTQYVNYSVVLPLNTDSTVNMIVEIPAGTTAKYEMSKDSYTLMMDSIGNQPRYIDYLGYPGNYGMIPNTILPKSEGGDGDPVDILMLGPAVHRGSVQKVVIIGVLELLDNGEQDDKLIAINPMSEWSKVKNIEALNDYYPGAKTIIATFFQNYKGKGKMELKGWSGKTRAMQILNASIQK